MLSAKQVVDEAPKQTTCLDAFNLISVSNDLPEGDTLDGDIYESIERRGMIVLETFWGNCSGVVIYRYKNDDSYLEFMLLHNEGGDWYESDSKHNLLCLPDTINVLQHAASWVRGYVKIVKIDATDLHIFRTPMPVTEKLRDGEFLDIRTYERIVYNMIIQKTFWGRFFGVLVYKRKQKGFIYFDHGESESYREYQIVQNENGYWIEAEHWNVADELEYNSQYNVCCMPDLINVLQCVLTPFKDFIKERM